MNGIERGGRRKILVVDDHDLFRSTVAEILRRRGFDPTEAKSGEAALAILEQTHETFDLVVTDVVMPGMNGVILAGRIQALYAGLKILLMSGYPFAMLEREYGMSMDHLPFFLAKPFKIETLADKVDEMTNGGRNL